VIGILIQWPPTHTQVLAYDFVSMSLFLIIALMISTFAGFSLPYLLKCAGAGAALPTLLLICIYPISLDVQKLFAIEVVEYVAMVGAAYGVLVSLHTLVRGP
jgi:hypothetical protein